MKTWELSFCGRKANNFKLTEDEQSIKAIAQILTIAPITIWNVLKRKAVSVVLNNSRARKASAADDRNIKRTEQTLNQLSVNINSLQRAGVNVTQSIFWRKRLHQKCGGYTKRCKPLILSFLSFLDSSNKNDLHQSDGKAKAWRQKRFAHDPSQAHRAGGMSWLWFTWLLLGQAQWWCNMTAAVN